MGAVAAVAVAAGVGAVVRPDTPHPAQARAAYPAGSAVAPDQPAPHGPPHWVAAWTAAPQAPAPGNLSQRGFADQTVRQIVFSSIGGAKVRVVVSNTFGRSPLTVGAASVAIQARGARLRSVRRLTFGGRPAVTLRPGSELASDLVGLTVAPGDHVAVSLYLPRATGPATQHSQARQVNYVAAGNRALTRRAAGFTTKTKSWYDLAGVDVLAQARVVGTVVAFGDSITDGVGSPTNANARWPNDLARRLAALPGATLSVVDAGIGGNRVLHGAACCGVSALARLRRDALAQPGARDLILLEGINDIGFSRSHQTSNRPHTNVSALQIVEGYEHIIAAAHAARIRVFGATLTPFAGARYWSPGGEAKREAVNRWITTSGAFDGVIDFAAAVADPGHPQRLRPAYDSGDHLHPNAAGYEAMADAVSLAMLLPRR